jgi:hypothetical protein
MSGPNIAALEKAIKRAAAEGVPRLPTSLAEDLLGIALSLRDERDAHRREASGYKYQCEANTKNFRDTVQALLDFRNEKVSGEEFADRVADIWEIDL